MHFCTTIKFYKHPAKHNKILFISAYIAKYDFFANEFNENVSEIPLVVNLTNLTDYISPVAMTLSPNTNLHIEKLAN